MNSPHAEHRHRRRLPGWLTLREKLGPRFLLGAGYVLAAALTAICVYLTTRAPGAGPIGPASQHIMTVLIANLVLILLLAASVGWSVFRILGARSQDAGARLHLRMASLFALAAVLPAIVVALFFGVLVTRGVESWFSSRVRTVVENSATVAKSYVGEQASEVSGEIGAMAHDLESADALSRTSPVSYGRLLKAQAEVRKFPAVYVIDAEGRIYASAESEKAPPYVAPPPEVLQATDEIHGKLQDFPSTDLFRTAIKLKSSQGDRYLYVARFVEHGILAHLRGAEASLIDYRDAEKNRRQIQFVFVMSYIETVLLVLVGAVWLGMAVANTISAPVGRLVQAAGRVAAGDLGVRVEAHKDPEEIAVLSRAFNTMTSDLQQQQQELKTASAEAESRRQFIETVLSGVSAGVLGLNATGRISAANRQALGLLGLDDSAIGKKLSAVAPELDAVAVQARGGVSEVEAEIDVVRRGDTKRLRVRASGVWQGGLVLTFDDITRLVAAQRNAAWKDVARRIAHEIKNPLTPIQLSAERLRRKYRAEIVGDLDTFDRCIETIIRQVGDIGRMVDEFSSFARMPTPKFAPANISELLRQGVFAQRVVDADTTIDLIEPAEDIQLVCDARMVGQALTNVLKNAGEAISGRKHLDPSMKGHITARMTADAEEVVIEVEDNGVGLPHQDRDRLTEPYVTTREKGTGLGLAIVKRILEDHGGELSLTDAAALPGAKAILRFPRNTTMSEPARQGEAAA